MWSCYETDRGYVEFPCYGRGCLILTDWIDDHSEMLSEWEAHTRYDMDFLVEKRKLDAAMEEIKNFFEINGIKDDRRS